jgi:hypothetical protein
MTSTTMNNQNINDSVNFERTVAFSRLADKKEIANTLLCTKACRTVIDTYKDTQTYGVCYRDFCSFAHSQEELKVPQCGFGDNCRYMWGKNGVPESACKFIHDNENIDEYYERACIYDVCLPKTSEFTRCIKKVQETPNKPLRKVLPRAPSKWDDKVLLEPIRVPITAKKCNWGDIVETEKNISAHESDSDSCTSDSNSYSTDSDHETRRRSVRRRSLEKKPKNKKQKKPICFVIRVPDKELATIALNAAFDRGQYNIQIIIDK